MVLIVEVACTCRVPTYPQPWSQDPGPSDDEKVGSESAHTPRVCAIAVPVDSLARRSSTRAPLVFMELASQSTRKGESGGVAELVGQESSKAEVCSLLGGTTVRPEHQRDAAVLMALRKVLHPLARRRHMSAQSYQSSFPSFRLVVRKARTQSEQGHSMS